MALVGQPLQLERVYEEIKWRIVYGRYGPGFVLSEGMLARVHRASRTPVRDALTRLLEEGYVERVPRRGFLVARITMAMIEQTFEVRQSLEVTAAGLAAERADPTAITRMRQLAEYPAFEDTQESYRERLSSNDKFHLAVAAAAQNGLLLDLVRRCLTQHDRVLSLGREYAVLPASVPQHHDIVNAIEAGDPAAARAAMASHLHDSFMLVRDQVASGRIRGVRG
jgi:DNA-binding GntR family transcriptional regulator